VFIYILSSISHIILTEDKANANGGRWLLTCGNQDTKLDELWLETLLGMIGDCFSHDRYILKD
jgi:hypothetical protein